LFPVSTAHPFDPIILNQFKLGVCSIPIQNGHGAAQIPWGQNCVLLERVKDAETRAFYIRKTVEHGWSRSVPAHQLDSKLHLRHGKSPSNFALTLPPAQSELARELLKDPYIFKPAPLDETASERAVENALLARLKDFLIELGFGFAFVGNQYASW